MTFADYTFILIGMFIVTFGIRFVLFAKAHKVVMPDFLERALKFVPVAVLTAIITPMIFSTDKIFSAVVSNEWFVGALSAFIVGVWLQKQLLTILIGVTVFFIVKFVNS
ncbi:AzlD domain-containing protein [Marinomonas sp. 15G1-11]|uniref:AzlD domain-containing protein n=1 Tax=Marinomonas phaeophyticola TaxID=3004091 RepID=A0ABT4JQD4_9GAMM|nr:AzlD domain-containing protein [Marinomonas sp. 15G1-11]MCZ2720450.1 AzlD domain-containing protein [Marinomonas sp. 15G1-11]